MKRYFVLLFGILLICSFVIGEVKEPTIGGAVGVGGQDEVGDSVGIEGQYNNMQDNINTYVPIGEDGKIDYGKYKPFVTKAELRIEAMNLWLDENVGWMRYIFNMKPAVSWLFLINVYVMICFFVALVLNAKALWFFIDNERKARIFGFAVFFILMVLRFYYGLANMIFNWLAYIFSTLINTFIWGVIFIFFICVILGGGTPVVLRALFAWLESYRAKRESFKQAAKVAANSEAMDALITEIGRR